MEVWSKITPKSKKPPRTETQRAGVAIFFWEGWLGVVPSLINGIRMLSDSGYDVDVMTKIPSGDYTDPSLFPASVRIAWLSARPERKNAGGRYPIQEGRFQPLSLVQRLSRKCLDVIRSRRFVELALRTSLPLRFIRLGLRLTKGKRYACFIGVDTGGLIAATVVGRIRRVPVVYWSLEMTFLKDFKDPINRMAKRLEKVCHRRALFTIIQGWERARALLIENGVISKVVIVPNAPLGPPPRLSSDFFHRKFRLPSSQRIILYAGMIYPAALSLELARAARTWPDLWTLIFHESFGGRDSSDPYLREIQDVGEKHVLLSLEPVSYDELDSLISSADIGIVAYDENFGDPNVTLMAGASGKLGQYLRCGLPVVCIAPPNLRELILEYQCGVVIRGLEDARSAIETIFADYQSYRANALRCYEEACEFGARFRQVLQEIHALERPIERE